MRRLHVELLRLLVLAQVLLALAGRCLGHLLLLDGGRVVLKSRLIVKALLEVLQVGQTARFLVG